MKSMMLLVEPMIPALRRYARSLLKDAASADDLVQDTLERTITRWHQRDPEGNARTWVFTILHNLAINQMRQAARRGRHVEIDDTDETMATQPPMQEERLLHADLLAALAVLPEEQRSVLLLVSVEDLSYAEAAKVLGVPIGTVMSRLSRARDRLMHLMEGDAPGPRRVTLLRSVK